ncbi:RES domain protein [Gimesia maris]|uniref:RES family NAD+ phosphorylase n=1 Tax=Gimesia maris TaxID=122 RepID=UPI00118CC9C5|nr:RES family NAD+ phosphorylase [Gimesia maris]QDT80941.1 RES domain protein [Gimesia maris]
MPEEAPGVQDLFDRIEKIRPHAIAKKEIAFRSAGVKYANKADLISGNGASYFGGRWNTQSLRAIYGSLSVQTAVSESYQTFNKFGFDKQSIRPRVIAGFEFKVKSLLDLTDASIRRKLGFSLTELLEEDWQAIQDQGEESWTQAIGRGAYRSGFQGLLVQSARDRQGQNVVIYPDSIVSPSYIKLIAEDDLPPPPSDWP